jgi:phosphatidylserine/phosphatidylglycerophosphate/cardiolipin synthase-like enzyme
LKWGTSRFLEYVLLMPEKMCPDGRQDRAARLRAKRLRTMFVVIWLTGCLAITTSMAAHSTEVFLSIDRNPIDVTGEAIATAEKSLDAVLYKFDDKGLKKAVERALQRGIRVRLIADEREAKRQRSYIKDLEKSGAGVRLWNEGKLHAKFAVIDGERVLTGSFNWTDSAQHRNTELIIDLNEPEFVKQFQELFERLWKVAESS